MRRSHIQAVAAIHDLRLSDLSLKIVNHNPSGDVDVTILSTQPKAGTLLNHVRFSCLFHLSIIFVRSLAQATQPIALAKPRAIQHQSV
jgi:hypothetical protein